MALLFFKRDPNKPKQAGDHVDRATILISWICVGVIIIGVVIVGIFSNTSISGKATVYAWMLGCLLLGVFIGFLFGIPKILQSSNQNPPPAPAPAPSPSGQDGGSNPPPPPPSPGNASATGISYQQQVNTNLTEISDWLTKIIVGLGLVNLKQVPEKLKSLATILAHALDKDAAAKGTVEPLSFAFAYGTITTYAILGFLFGYISTRVYLAGLFLDADRRSLAIDKALSELNTTKAAVDSANRKVEFALANTTAAASPQAADPAIAQATPTETLARLVREYNEIRRTLKASDLRTQKMTAIIAQMVTVAPSVEGFDVLAMLKDNDSGNRLSAYAYLYARPDYKYLGDIVEALVTDLPPFNQFWAIQALGKIIALQPNAVLPFDVYTKLQTYYDKLQDGWDRKYELAKIVPSLKK